MSLPFSSSPFQPLRRHRTLLLAVRLGARIGWVGFRRETREAHRISSGAVSRYFCVHMEMHSFEHPKSGRKRSWVVLGGLCAMAETAAATEVAAKTQMDGYHSN